MKRGDVVDEFVLPDQTGTDRTFSDFLAAGPVVLFFYPAAMTPGCTKEACHFRDLAAEFAAVGAQRVGISTDTVDKQAQFADKQKFDYPLLSDVDGTVATQFGVKRGLLGKFMPVKRTTFVIDTDGKVLDVIASEVSMDTHADKALEVLRARSANSA
ncbi:peroxiredoxin BcpB [soil metagenome]